MVDPKMLVYFLLISLLLSLGNTVIQITNANSNEIITTQKHKGFSLKLIHRDSPNSPMYRPNLTKTELMKGYAQLSKFRLKSLARLLVCNTSRSQYLNDRNRVIRPPISMQDNSYLVKVGLGTFSANPRYHTSYLTLDTGSDLIWTDCANSFHHVGPKFDASQSHSYRPFDPHHCPPLTFPEEGNCRRLMSYGDGSHAKVNMAYETFSFESGNGLVPLNISFGCGIDVAGFNEGQNPNNKISGVLGMNYGEKSLVKQAHDITHGQFSYCLQFTSNQHANTVPMVLRFGDDIIQPHTTYSTRTFKRGLDELYFLDLRGLKVDDVDLHVRRGVFDYRKGRGGGCIIDSGSTSSFLVSEAFHMLRNAVATYIETHNSNVRRYEDPYGFYDLCYIRVHAHPRTVALPSVTFVFVNNVEFKAKSDQVFIDDRTDDGQAMSCLFIFESTSKENGLSILGAYQQVNHRIIYDTDNNMLHFGPADCYRHN